LCCSHTVDITVEFTKKLSTGFFGGEGFVLQGLTGKGDVMVKAGGTLIRKDLKEGEVLRISSGAWWRRPFHDNSDRSWNCLVARPAASTYD
jgi:uncharacterized protein (AIM24 family)